MAQTIQFIPCTDGGAGTSKQSFLFASTNDLKTMFGDPWFEGIGDKISTDFCIDYQVNDENGDSKYGTFTLYDWHFARNLNDDYAETQWNIGGKSYDDACAADLALKLFKETNESLVFAKLHTVPEDEEFFL